MLTNRWKSPVSLLLFPTCPLPPSRSTHELSAALGGWISSTTAVSEVTRRLLDYFTSGPIAAGTRLPPERQLASSMGVGRSAIREALAALEILGVVSVRPGSGTYLRGNVSELLPQTLSWGMMLGEPKTRELIGVRHGLEVQAARLAAVHISDDALAELEAHTATMAAHKSTSTRSSPPTCTSTSSSPRAPTTTCSATSCRASGR